MNNTLMAFPNEEFYDGLLESANDENYEDSLAFIDISNYENNMIGYERCLQYTKIPPEQPSHKVTDDALGKWPSKGKIEFVNFSVKYRPDTEIGLKNLNNYFPNFLNQNQYVIK